MPVNQATWFVVFRSDFSEEDRVIEFSNQASTFVKPTGELVARGWRVTNGSFPIDAAIPRIGERKTEFFIQTVRRSLPETIFQRLTDRNRGVRSATNTGANSSQVQVALAIGGERPTGGSSTYYGLLTGQIAEVLVYNRSLGTSEMTAVEDYLFTKYFGPPDLDIDGLPDSWEQSQFGNLGQDGDGVGDGDLLNNRAEFLASSNPTLRDSDGDGLDDARELAAGTSPNAGDSDLDGAGDPLELLAGTNPSGNASTPAAVFGGLKIHSDLQSAEPERLRFRNLAGPGDGTSTIGLPEFKAAGIAGEGIRLGGGAGIDWGLRDGIAAGPFTVSLAFRPEAGGGTRFLASQGNRDFTRPGWSLFLDDGGLALRIANAARNQFITLRHAATLVPGEWHVVAFSIGAGGEVTPYLDGSSAGWSGASGSLAGGFGTIGSPVLLGLSDAADQGFSGGLDEFSLWSRALDAGEIAALHANALAGRGLDGQVRAGAPAFTAEAQGGLVFCGQGFTLRAEAPGALLQWRKNGGNLAGKNLATLSYDRAELTDAGRYHAVASAASAVRPGAEALVRIAPSTLTEVSMTRAGVTAPGSRGFQMSSMALQGDSLAFGIPTHKAQAQGNQVGQVRFLRRNAANPNQWDLAQVIDAPQGNGLYFGYALAMQGNTLVVGAYGANSFGINRFGRVFVYQRASSRSSWSLLQEIPSPILEDNDRFGSEIALDGNTMVIGAPGETKAMLYKRTVNTWSLQLTFEPAGNNSRTLTYGSNLALQGDVLAIGEYRTSNNSLNATGGVFLHHRNQGGAEKWGLVQKIQAPVPSSSDEFGLGIALDGPVLAVNHPKARTLEIHRLDPATATATWTATIPRPQPAGTSTPSTTEFGRQMDILGDYLLVGEPQYLQFGSGAGAGFLFRRDPGTERWTLLHTFASSDASPLARFGTTVAMQGNELVIGAREGANHVVDIGAAYAFRITRDTLPEFIGAPPTLADSGEAMLRFISCRVVDDANPVISAVDPLPAWLEIQNIGGGRARLVGTPPAGTTGSWPIRLTATETWSIPAFHEFTLHVMPGNLQPVLLRERIDLEGPEDAASIGGDLGLLFADGEDAAADLSYEWVSTPPAGLFQNSGFSAGESTLDLIPVPDANGSADLRVRARDRGGLATEAEVRVTVTPVNDTPVATALPEVIADAAASPSSRDLSAFFNDVDLSREGDELGFAIVSNSAPELFSSISINPANGTLDFGFAPYRSGQARVGIRASDRAGESVDEVLTVTVAAIPPPELAVATAMALNRQTGLHEQTITITNNGPRAIGGFDLSFAGLPAGVRLNNTSGDDAHGALIEMRRPLAIGQSVTVVAEFYVPGRQADFKPQVGVEVTLPQEPAVSAGSGFAIDRSVRLDDGAFLIEFTTQPGRSYRIEYSEDAANWKASPVGIRAAGTKLQWIDRGPPRTETAPPAAGSRFYRVKEDG